MWKVTNTVNSFDHSSSTDQLDRPLDRIHNGGAASGTETMNRPPVPPPPPSAQKGRGGGLGWRGFAAALAAGAIGATGVVVPTQLANEEVAAPAPTAEQTTTTESEPIAEAPASMTEAIAREVGPSVARVDVVTANGRGSGSAVVYQEEGILVTNAHVVSSAGDVSVTLADGERMDAEVVGADPRSDLAVLRVDAEGLPVPQWAPPAHEPAVGEPVVAIGSPFGLDGSVTSGIVSALGRTLPGGGTAVPLVDLLQTDAAINPGNSGGALVDGAGRIIGVNTAILSRTGGNQGIGFAIPADAVRDVADQLLQDGTVEHAQLGVAGQSVDADIAQLYGLPVSEGAIIAEVTEGSPAAEAGLQRGDLIVSLGGDPVESVAELAGRVRQHQPGDQVEVEFYRNDELQSVTVELGEVTPTG